MRTTTAFLMLGLLPLAAQEIKIPESLERLAAKAKETVNVSLDANMLQLAGNFLSTQKEGEAKVRELTGKLKGVYVRSFEFEKEGEYSDADVQPLRAQLTRERGWSRIVDVAEKNERTEVYVNNDGERMNGVALIAAEPRELTVVYVDGPIDLKHLSDLAGIDIGAAMGGAIGAGRRAGAAAPPKPPKPPKPPAQ
jgi:hypothetical protein